MFSNHDVSSHDDFFALMGEDVDFSGDPVVSDVPVLTYYWSNTPAVARLGQAELMRRGRNAMNELGFVNLRWQGRHLRGDTTNGQRVKMTVLRCGGDSMFFVMTAGMPGTRAQAKLVNRQVADQVEFPKPQLSASKRQQSRLGPASRRRSPAEGMQISNSPR